MTQVVGGPVTIELGELGPDEPSFAGRGTYPRLRRQLGAAALAVLCLLTVASSNRGTPRLGEPLWTGEVSLNGFALGTTSVYTASSSADRVLAHDLRTGRERWSVGITDLPDRVIDMGGGIAAVTTRALSTDTGPNPRPNLEHTIRFIRESTGEQIFQTVGGIDGPSAPGLPAVVFTERRRTDPRCATEQTPCYDLTAWNIETGAVAWRLSLPPGDYAALTFADNGADGLLEMTDGAIRMRDLATGAVVGQLARPAVDLAVDLSVNPPPPTGPPAVIGDVVVMAERETEQIVLTAYRRPALTRLWTSALPAPRLVERTQLSGFFFMSGCGGWVCLHIDGRTSQLVDLATGTAGPPIEVEVSFPLGPDVLVASPTPFKPARGGLAVYVVDASSRVVAEHDGFRLVEWIDSDHRALLAEPGPNRTRFVMLDEHGVATPIGAVTGAELVCSARGDILACSDPVGKLRIWRLPVVA